MGWVDIPGAPPAGGGRMRASLLLEPAELAATVDLLKGALQELTAGLPNGLAPAGEAATPAAAAGAASAAAAAQQQRAAAAPAPAAPAAARAPHAAPPRPLAPVPAPQQFVQPVQPVQQPRQLRRRRGPRRSSTRRAGAGGAAGRARRRAETSTRWRECFATDPEEHAGGAVTALAYVPELPGLPSFDGHAGWLVTGSRGMLNLWEANRAASGDMALMVHALRVLRALGRAGCALRQQPPACCRRPTAAGAAALPPQCMHSRAVGVTPSRIVAEPRTQTLFAVGTNLSDGTECVSVHSAEPEMLLSLRYRFAPPPERARSQQRLMQQVVTVHGITPGLSRCAIASYGERLLIFEAKPELGETPDVVVHAATHHFVAHPGSVVTALHRAPLEGSSTLASGAADGAVHLWDLRAPPNMPRLRLAAHGGAVTGLELIGDDRLVTGGADGRVLLWDSRAGGAALHAAAAPGGAGVSRIAVGPWGDVVAVSTPRGLHCLELFDFGAPMTHIAPWPLPRGFTDVAFNAVTHDLYAGDASGAVLCAAPARGQRALQPFEVCQPNAPACGEGLACTSGRCLPAGLSARNASESTPVTVANCSNGGFALASQCLPARTQRSSTNGEAEPRRARWAAVGAAALALAAAL
ncbi:hypothetical protein HT031_004948 [Scenedesmus sp. PABB004]|nr:hypothetical protein HT031_004948 [Scenedesmus sp. PABB004]